MKSYTDIEQSKKLAEILQLESADMCWILVNYGDEAGSRHEPSLATYKTGSHFRDRIFPKDHTIPCWSLAALLGVLPDTINGTYCRLTIDKEGDVYNISYDDILSKETTILYAEYSLIDACYKMIIRLNELKIL